MSTTIDSLVIDIQSSSTNAVASIESLAGALKKMKKSTISKTAIQNLQGLTKALKELTPVSSNASKLGAMAESLRKLSAVGSLGGVINQLSRLPEAMRGLSGVSMDGMDSKFERLALAAGKLSNVKAGGLPSMVNALAKIGDVTARLDDKAIDDFAERVEKLTDKLEPLSRQMTTVKAGLSGVNGAARQAGTGVSEMGKAVKSVKLSSFIFQLQQMHSAITWAVTMLSNFMADAIEWEGVSARFGRGFGPQAQETYEWIQLLNKEMGINVQQFMQYSSIYATMLTGFGVAQKDASTMALGYAELTYDIWAGYNDIYKTYAEAADAVRSAIAGEVEPIRRAGFTIVESTLEQTAKNNDLTISLEKATEAEKSYLRYLTLVEQAHSQSLVGTYAKEMNTAEGVMRTFTQQLRSLQQALGSLFLPILVEVIPWLQAFVSLLTDAVHWVAALFGVKIQKIDPDSWGLSGMGDSANNATESVNGTTKALKELKNATLGIDELNVISPPSNSGGAGAGGVGGGSGFDGLEIDSLWDKKIFDDIESQVGEIKEKLKGWMPVIAGIAAGFAALSLIKLIKQIKNIGTMLGVGGAVGGALAGIKEFFQAAKQMAPEVGWLAALFPKLSGWFASIGGAISGAASAVATFVAGLTAPAWVAIAAVIVAVASTVYYLYQNWDELGQAVKNFFAENIAPKLEKIKGHFDKMKEALEPLAIVLAPVVEFFKNLGIAIADFFKNIDWNELLGYLGKVVEYFGHNVFTTLTTPIVVLFNVLVGAIENFIQVISGVVQVVSGVVGFVVALFTGGDIEGSVNKMVSGISDIFGGLWGLLTDPIVNVYEGIVGWFTELWDVLVGHSIVPDIVNDVVSWFAKLPSSVFKAIGNFFSDLVNDFKGLWSNLTKWWNGKTKLSEYTPSIGSIKNKLSSAWTTAKSWWDKSKAALASYTPSIGNIKDKLSSAWTTAKNWWSKSKSALSYTPTIGSIKDKLVSAWNTAKSWWNKNVKLSIPSLSFKVAYSKPSGVVQKAVVKALGLDGWPKLSFAANGGMFDAGSLIWAGERGAEIVANAAGGKTGVMNVAQMQDAVYEGVYAAMAAVMRTSGGGGNAQAVNVYLDGKQIYSSMEQHRKERGASLMGNQVYAY